MNKKCLAMVLCAALVMSVTSVPKGSEDASAKERAVKQTAGNSMIAAKAATGSATSEDDFYYDVDDGEVTITGVRSDGDITEVSIPSKIDGYPVTTIGYNAFGWSNIEKFTLPSTIKRINSSAFSHCEKLKNITLPSSLKVLGYSAFSYCSQLRSITIPASVTELSQSTFGNCTRLKSVTFKTRKIDYIPTECFEYCKRLEAFSIPSSVKSIENYAFWHCSKLASVKIGSKVNRINDYAFAYNYALKNIAIPSSVRSIGRYAFRNCTNMTGITFKGKKTQLSDHTFESCKALKKIRIPDSMSTVPEYCFGGCESLSSVKFSSNMKIIKKGAFRGCAGLKSVRFSKKIYAISDRAFVESGLKKVKLNKELQYIGNSAFKGTNLKKVTLPGKVAYIGNAVFKDCEKLKSIRIPASVKGLNPGALGGCLNLKNITVAKSNTNYSSSKGVLFDKNKTILIQYPMNRKGSSYTVPATVQTIRRYAFEENRNLKKVSTHAATIQKRAFANMRKIKTITLGYGVNTIEENAFCDNETLKTLTIPDTVTKIGTHAFASSGIRSAHIPYRLRELSGDAFYECFKLKSFTGYTYGKYTVIDGVLYSDYSKTLLQYPAKKKNTSFTVPETVTRVKSDGFWNAKNLKKLYFGSRIRDLETGSIRDCDKLRQIVFDNRTKLQTGRYAISGCDKIAVIVGPSQEVLWSMADNANATLITL